MLNGDDQAKAIGRCRKYWIWNRWIAWLHRRKLRELHFSMLGTTRCHFLVPSGQGALDIFRADSSPTSPMDMVALATTATTTMAPNTTTPVP